MSNHDGQEVIERHEHVSYWFGLSYANYYVMPRVILEAMPNEWQEQWVKLVNQIDETFDLSGMVTRYEVRVRGERGRYEPDPLNEYRHPDKAFIDSLRRKPNQECEGQ